MAGRKTSRCIKPTKYLWPWTTQIPLYSHTTFKNFACTIKIFIHLSLFYHYAHFSKSVVFRESGFTPNTIQILIQYNVLHYDKTIGQTETG